MVLCEGASQGFPGVFTKQETLLLFWQQQKSKPLIIAHRSPSQIYWEPCLDNWGVPRWEVQCFKIFMKIFLRLLLIFCSESQCFEFLAETSLLIQLFFCIKIHSIHINPWSTPLRAASQRGAPAAYHETSFQVTMRYGQDEKWYRLLLLISLSENALEKNSRTHLNERIDPWQEEYADAFPSLIASASESLTLSSAQASVSSILDVLSSEWSATAVSSARLYYSSLALIWRFKMIR